MVLDKEKLLFGISKVIIDNRQELIDKLDELELACSCTMFDASDKDLSDIVIESLEVSPKFREWIVKKIAGKGNYFNAGADPITAIANAIGAYFTTMGKGLDIVKSGQEKKKLKDQWKRDLTNKIIDARMQQEKEKSRERVRNTFIMVGASLLILGVGFAIYYGSKTKIKQPPLYAQQ